MKIQEALQELRKNEKKKFDQTVDLIVNLKGIDLKRENVSLVATLPHVFKEKKICGFLQNKSDRVKTITKPEFERYKDPAALKALVGDFDFFIAHASLMPSVATVFGKVLGPAGKMPSPQLGLLMTETPEAIDALIKKISTSIKIRAKEMSLKIPVGKESMKDEHLVQNIDAILKEVVVALPSKKENVKKVLLKFTMTKPVALEA